MSNLYVRDGTGTGNAVVRCGQSDFLITANLTSGSSGITVTSHPYGGALLNGATVTDLTTPGNIASNTTVSSVSSDGLTITIYPGAGGTASGDLLDIVPLAVQGNGWREIVRTEADGTVITGPMMQDYDFYAEAACHVCLDF